MINFLLKQWGKLLIIAAILLCYIIWLGGDWQMLLSPSVVISVVIVIIIVSLWIIWIVPQIQVARLMKPSPQVIKETEHPLDNSPEEILPGEPEGGETPAEGKDTLEPLKPNEIFTLENEARKTLAQIVGGIVVIIGLAFTGANLWITQREAERNRALTLEGQVTDRYTKAITQLGDEKLEVRLGGIYALERIAKDSPKDHWTIMEVLTAYVRKKAPRKDNHGPINSDSQEEETDSLATDIQAVMTVLGRRLPHYGKGEDGRLNLRNVALQNARLQKANFIGADFIGADLREVYFTEADLRGADLGGADLHNAYLTKANLTGADLSGADLSESQDLTWEQIDGAIINELTKLPHELELKKEEKLKRQSNLKSNNSSQASKP